MLYTATLTTPLHHGAGTAGNTSLLRTADIVLPDGRQAKVPFVSGNSIRNLIRRTLAWDLARTLPIPEGSLSKAAVDLIWSGGAVTSTGAQVDLDMARRVDAVLPSLGLLGYAAQSDITAGTLRVSALNLVCEENAWRTPFSHSFSQIRAARFRGEEFGTRHDVAGTPVERFVEIATSPSTTQMIYDMQVLKPGSVLWGEITTTDAATDRQRLALTAALSLAAPDGIASLAAKTATGFGQATVTWGREDQSIQAWHDHLTTHRDDILALVKDLTS